MIQWPPGYNQLQKYFVSWTLEETPAARAAYLNI